MSKLNAIRAQTIQLLNQEHRSISTMLIGNTNLTVKENEQIFDIIHKYIKLSRRFE